MSEGDRTVLSDYSGINLVNVTYKQCGKIIWKFLFYLGSVSYTHLDVYKRQDYYMRPPQQVNTSGLDEFLVVRRK